MARSLFLTICLLISLTAIVGGSDAERADTTVALSPVEISNGTSRIVFGSAIPLPELSPLDSGEELESFFVINLRGSSTSKSQVIIQLCGDVSLKSYRVQMGYCFQRNSGSNHACAFCLYDDHCVTSSASQKALTASNGCLSLTYNLAAVNLSTTQIAEFGLPASTTFLPKLYIDVKQASNYRIYAQEVFFSDVDSVVIEDPTVTVTEKTASGPAAYEGTISWTQPAGAKDATFYIIERSKNFYTPDVSQVLRGDILKTVEAEDVTGTHEHSVTVDMRTDVQWYQAFLMRDFFFVVVAVFHRGTSQEYWCPLSMAQSNNLRPGTFIEEVFWTYHFSAVLLVLFTILCFGLVLAASAGVIVWQILSTLKDRPPSTSRSALKALLGSFTTPLSHNVLIPKMLRESTSKKLD
jgi:hypothetical protein